MSSDNGISSVLVSLGTGSGIDIRKLAEDLTNVERAPAEERLNSFKEAKTAQISAYAVLKFNVDELISRFSALDDVSELLSSSASSDDTTTVSVSSATGSANSGTHSISVSSIAAQQINISNSYTSESKALNGGSGFSIEITDGSSTTTTVTIEDGFDTPAGVVAAINASGANVSASLLTVGTNSDEVRIVLRGSTGSANSFTVDSELSDADLGFHDSNNGNSQQSGGINAQQLAANAIFTVDGVSLQRASNTVTDAITGVSFELKGAHATGASTQINLEKSDSLLKEKLQDLVESYNATRFALSEIADPDSADEDVGGALASDFATIRQVRSIIYDAVTGDSSTPSGSVTALRDIGVELKRNGDLEFNEVTFDAVMQSSADDVAIMLSAGTDNQSKFDGQPQGLARDAIAEMETLTDSIDGLFATRTQSSITALSGYEEKLEELDVRMSELFDRYIAQFTVMEALVSQLNSTRTSLADTWMNMGNFNNK